MLWWCMDMMVSMAEDSGFRDIKRKPKPGWERWRPPPPDRWARAGFRGKTVWDWLDLLIVPLMLALITVAFTWQQSARQNDIEDRRAQAERELAEQRAQDEALQAYLDQMSQLMLKSNLLKTEEGDPVYTLAQARTSTVITRLDADRNRSVTRFLTDSHLTQTRESPGQEVALLSRIEVEGAELSGAGLVQADLEFANLRDANLSGAFLPGAYLAEADLRDANLRDANLSGADLTLADLRGADLRGADLSASTDVAFEAEGDVLVATAAPADLSDADLRRADLSEAEGITNEQLAQQTDLLEDATMPDGAKYEDWLKSRGSR